LEQYLDSPWHHANRTRDFQSISFTAAWKLIADRRGDARATSSVAHHHDNAIKNFSTMEAAPESITVSKGGAKLVISVRDGVSHAIDAPALRLACRCAHCTRARIDGKFPERFDGVTIAEVTSMGHYGLNITFSDGHARGIFPWSYLAELPKN